MKITPEMMGKFANCKSAEEVLELAKHEKYSMTMEQSQKVFDLLQSEDMTDAAMEKICGGMVATTLTGPLAIGSNHVQK